MLIKENVGEYMCDSGKGNLTQNFKSTNFKNWLIRLHKKSKDFCSMKGSMDKGNNLVEREKILETNKKVISGIYEKIL